VLTYFSTGPPIGGAHDQRRCHVSGKQEPGTKTSVHVFVNREKVDLYTTELTGAELLAEAGFEGQGWDLLKLQGEGDPSGGELILHDQTLTLKNGDRFRVIPGNRTFGGT
jgi:hypothetical protein